jgi:hypothetical protein
MPRADAVVKSRKGSVIGRDEDQAIAAIPRFSSVVPHIVRKTVEG